MATIPADLDILGLHQSHTLEPAVVSIQQMVTRNQWKLSLQAAVQQTLPGT